MVHRTLHKRLSQNFAHSRDTIPEHFPDAIVRRSVELDLSLITHYDELLGKLEQQVALMAKAHDAFTYHLLRRAIHGSARTHALTRP